MKDTTVSGEGQLLLAGSTLDVPYEIRGPLVRGSASATPALVFPSLIRNARNHSKTIRSKVGASLAEWFEDHIADIASGLEGSFPKTLPLEEQGRFALGYYHQRDVFRRRKDVPAEIETAEAAADTSPEDE